MIWHQDSIIENNKLDHIMFYRVYSATTENFESWDDQVVRLVDFVNRYGMCVTGWPRICSVCHSHKPVLLSSIVTYHRIFNKSNMADVTVKQELLSLLEHLNARPVSSGGLCCSVFCFLLSVCGLFFVFLFFFLLVIVLVLSVCLSIFLWTMVLYVFLFFFFGP
jgi:hypothetical protein